jgi:hypothetical protein
MLSAIVCSVHRSVAIDGSVIISISNSALA